MTTFTLMPNSADWWFGTVGINADDIAGLCDADQHADCCAEGDHPITPGYCLRACVDVVPVRDGATA